MPYAPLTPQQFAFGAAPPEKRWTQKLMDSWAAKGAVNAVSWLGESLNRLNVAKNALLIGDVATVGKAMVPFYETLGFGEVRDITGEDVLREWGIPAGQKWRIPLISRLIGRKTTREIFGFLALDVLGDPLMWLGGPGLTKSGVAAKKAQAGLFAQGRLAEGLAAFPTSWGAQAAKGYRAAVRFGISPKRAIPLIRGKAALEFLEKGATWAKFAKAGQPRAWARMFNLADSPISKALKKYVDINTLEDAANLDDLARAFDAKDRLLSPAMRSQVAEAMEAAGRAGQGRTIGKPFTEYPAAVQDAADAGAEWVGKVQELAKKTGLTSGDMGDWIGEQAATWERAITAKEKVQEAGIQKLGAPRERVIRAIDKTISDLQIPAVDFPAGAPPDDVIENIKGLMDLRDDLSEAARATGPTAEKMRALERLWESAPGRKFTPQTFARLLRGFGVDVPEAWRGEGGTLSLLTKYMADALGPPEDTLAAARKWMEKWKLAEGTLPGYVPRGQLTRAGRAGLEKARAEVGKRLVDMPDDIILRSRAAYETFIDPAIGDRAAAKRARHWLMGKEATPGGDEFARQMARAFIDKDTGQYLGIEEVNRLMEDVERKVAAGAKLGRKEALAVGAKARYGFLERWADQVITGRTRTVPALYAVEAEPGRALARMMDNIVDQVKGKKFIEAIKDAGEDFIVKGDRGGWIDGSRISGKLQGYSVHPQLAAAAKDLTNRLGNTQNLGRIAGLASDAIAFWKRITLGPFLAYQTRNIITDILNDFFVTGNRDLTTLSRSWRALRDPTTVIDVAGVPTKAKDFLRTASAANLGVSFVEGEVLSRFRTSWARGMDKLGAQIPPSLRWLNPFSESFLITRMGRQREKVHRLASFLHQLDEGVDAVTAAGKVKAAFFDYGPKGFSPWEQKYMRSIFPFYSFLRKNTALQAHLLFKRPFYIGAQLKAVPGERTEDEKEEMKILPPAVREGLTFRAGRDKDTVTYIKGLGLPVEDVAELLSMGTGPGRIAERLLARTSPLIKMPLEWLNDRNFYFGTKISEYDRGYKWMRILPKSWQKFLGFKEVRRKGRPLRWRMDPWKLWALSQIRFFTTLGKLTDADRPAWQRFAWGATGIRPMRFDIEQMRMRAERREMDRLAEELRRRGEIGVMEIPYARAGIEPTPEAKALLEAFRESQRQRRRQPALGF